MFPSTKSGNMGWFAGIIKIWVFPKFCPKPLVSSTTRQISWMILAPPTLGKPIYNSPTINNNHMCYVQTMVCGFWIFQNH